MLRKWMVIAAGLVLGGCGGRGLEGMSYAMSEYGGVEAKNFEMPGDDVYRIWDKSDQNRMMISISAARAVAIGSVQGMTMNAVDAMPQSIVYEKAALAYLESTGRRCEIVGGSLLVKPKYEFKYDCGPLAVPGRRR